jgi:hypothetical protein
MTPALLVALALGQPPSGPLSPADLPPPPRPAESLLPTAPARPVGPAGMVYISTNVWQANGSPDEVRRKAVAVLAGYPGIRFAADGPGGIVEGYTDDTRVQAIALPVGTKTQVFVAAASPRRASADRCSKAVQDGVEARAVVAEPVRFGRPDPGHEKALPVLNWHWDIRSVPALARHTKPLSMYVMEKAGLVPDGGFDGSVAGVVAVSFEVRDRTGCGWQFVMPGVPGADLHFVTVSAAAPGARQCPAALLGESLIRLLYD